MGQVYLGFSPAGRPMAVKVVHPELARDKAFISRFRQETAAARKVSGAYTASVVDAGEGDLPWLATTLVVGPSLDDAVEQQGPLPEVSVWRLAAGLAEALAEVHSHGLVHRDLKPSNVLLAVDGPRVIDFGISRALDGTSLTGTGMIVGTPAFMSPEQATGMPVGPATDVFSFGGVVTFAATGSPPFGEGNPVAMIYRVVHGEPMLAGLPAALADLVNRCLVRSQEDRATLAELMEIITANLAPATSATSFWPPSVAEFIGSYQARFTADTRALSAPVPEQAEPTAPRVLSDTRGSARLSVPTEVEAPRDDQDASATVTAPRAAPTPAPASIPAASPPAYTLPPGSPPAYTPPPVSPAATQPPVSVPGSPSPPVRGPRRRGALIAGIGTLAAVVVAVVVVATSLSSGHSPASGRTTTSSLGGAANASPPGGFGTIPAESGTPHAGTVSFPEPPGDSPSWILPLVTAADETVYNVYQFDYQMWRPLYWPNEGVSPGIDAAMSLAKPPAWSNGDKTVTVTMKASYKWSDGQPVSAQDVAFDIDLIKAAVAESPGNWGPYNPGSFPDDVASLSTPDSSTLVVNLKSAVNPMWFYEDELAALQPMPAHAWAKAAAGGSVLDFSNPANAKKIYDYLAAQSKALSTWATNPLWRLVDGPYRLTSFNTSGADTMTANPAYRGPGSHEIKVLHGVPFSTDAAEFSALQAGSIDVGYVPAGDVAKVPRLKSGGDDVFGYPDFGWSFAVYNFKDSTGDFNHIVAQLYFRQTMAHLQNQQDYIKSFMHGAGSPDYGPVPLLPASQYTPGNAKDTYPFSLATAKGLLASHGWRVVPNGTDTCVRPGSGADQCGAGIPAGTRLAFNLIYNNGTPLIGQEVNALTAEAKQAGIAITLTASSFDDIIGNDDNPAAPADENKWAMDDFGGFTQSTYPTTITVFNTQGLSNIGSYSDPQADQLINASVSSSDPNAVKNETAYLTAQQPGLFQPNQDLVFGWNKKLSGPVDSFANLTQYYFTPEFWYFTS